MDKKYLLSNGDSWTLGFMLDTEYMRLKTMFKMKMNYEHLSKLIEDEDLDEWSWYIENTKLQKESYDFSVKIRFTGLVSKKMGLEEINISYPGKSNRAIMRTTIEWILDNQDKVKDTFFLIGWTSPHRTESVSEDKDEYEIGVDSNVPFSEIKTLYDIINLQNYFKVNDIDYMFIDLFSGLFMEMPDVIRNPYDDTHRNFTTSLGLYNDLLKTLDKDNFLSEKSLLRIIEENVDGGNLVAGNQFCELPIENNYSDDYKDFVGHPSISSSKIIGDLIYEKISSDNK